MPKRKSPTPVYFTALDFENVRCFSDKQPLDLTVDGDPARWTLIIGENGVGKTTLLQCLAWMRLVPHDVPEGASEPDDNFGGAAPIMLGTLGPALEEEENEVFESLLRKGESSGFKLNAELSPGGHLSLVSREEKRPFSMVEHIRTGVRVAFGNKGRLSDVKYTNLPKVEDSFKEGFYEPLVVTYGANRPVSDFTLALDELDTPTDTSRLSKLTPLFDMEEILTGLDYASAINGKESQEHKERERLLSMLQKILPDEFGPKGIEIYPPDVLDSGKPSGVFVNTFSGTVPMSSLSLGYQTTLAWTMDLAWRLLRRYPSSKNPLSEPAVVLIDEIDLHLHPRWQLRIIDDLSSVFSGTQFIATAHSPLMVQIAQDANLVLLQRRETDVEIVNDPEIVRGWRVDQILSSPLFGVPRTRDSETEALFTRRDELLDMPSKTPKEQTELEELQLQISDLPTAQTPKDQEAMEFIRKAAALLKSKGVGA